jgi:hypothetical protein
MDPIPHRERSVPAGADAGDGVHRGHRPCTGEYLSFQRQYQISMGKLEMMDKHLAAYDSYMKGKT